MLHASDRKRHRHSAQASSGVLATGLGILWALPLSLLGLLLVIPVLAMRGRIYLVQESTPALLVRGPLADYLLAHHPFGAMSAMAVGHVVLAERKRLTRQTLVHELAHVRQAARWGVFFPLAYLAASLWAVMHGEDAYWNNLFEMAARDAEKHA